MTIASNSHLTLNQIATQLEQPGAKLRVNNGDFYVKQSSKYGQLVAYFSEKGLDFLPSVKKHQQNNKATVELFKQVAAGYGVNVADSGKKTLSASTVNFVLDNRKHNFGTIAGTIADRYGAQVSSDVSFGVFRGVFYDSNKEAIGARFGDILPPKHSQVHLSNGLAVHANKISIKDDIASFIPNKGETFAMQAPTKQTRSTIDTQANVWKMIAEQKIGVVVDLTNAVDEKKRAIPQYRPVENNEPKPFGQTVVTKIKLGDSSRGPLYDQKLADGDITKTKYSVAKRNEQAGRADQVRAIKFHKWPDHGVIKLEQLSRLVEVISDAREKSTSGNVLVHCTAGVGRTGTVITAEKLYQLNKTDKLNLANYKETVDNLIADGRVSRGKAYVQTEEQYKLLQEYAASLVQAESDYVYYS
ncbi:protein-tyrosine phosphatase family protein [Spartinivicinus poritis]|uniref:Protein-tyrosine phosphatase family protein n=1 Tax=Spartinivicinus poritis TaxID=2994640 RepID=A0ABT5UEW7_9GAMM|nr:protein-tyrosine phosphatase family protein [Spartinivicinus sp. A2-2]MDE1464052.1 protein-tyrosine phosphatase family protein [Spartinivicinus sp. A2-2]